MIDHYGWQFRFRSRLHGSTSMTSRAVPSGRRPAVGRVIRMRDAKGYNFGDGRGAIWVSSSWRIRGPLRKGQLLDLHGNARWGSLRGSCHGARRRSVLMPSAVWLRDGP